MNVTRRNDAVLQIRPIRSGIFIGVIGAVFVAVGYWALSETGPAVARWIAGGIPLVAGAVTLVYGLLTCYTVWTLDRVQGTITHRQIRLTGGMVKAYPLSDVVGTRVDVSSSSEGETYRLELVTAQGEVIPMTPFHTGRRRSLEKVAVVIREFLDLPEPRQPS